MYGFNSNADDYSSSTENFIKSYRCDTSQITLSSLQKGARHFHALFDILALDETSLLMAECEDLFGFGNTGHEVVYSIFYVEVDPVNTVDHCASLLDCDVTAPVKRLVWERQADKQLDGIAWGPVAKYSKNIYIQPLHLPLEMMIILGLIFNYSP